MSAREEQVLRAVTYRISAATQQELPGIVRAASHQLLDCRTLLSSEPSKKKDSTNHVVLHKFKTQVTTLLNGKTPEARWAGIVLTKAAVELGGYEVLSKSGGWVRCLLQNLNRPDPASSKKLAALALTRVFDLTHGHQSLVREITTPSLKDYIGITLNLIQPKKKQSAAPCGGKGDHDLLAAILQTYAHLLPSHPSIFRSHLTQLESLLLPLIVCIQTFNSSHSVQAAARRCFTLLHYCTPKTNNNSPSDSYAKTLASVIRSSHITCSFVLRSIIEDWSPLRGQEVPNISIPIEVGLKPSDTTDGLRLPSWTGIDQGCQRLRDLFSLLCDFLESATSGQVAFALVAFVDLVFRICNVTVPQPVKGSKGSSAASAVRINDQVSQQEREALYNQLPSIHASAVKLVSALCERLGAASKPVQEVLLEQTVWVFAREKYNIALRAACYDAVSAILGASAAAFPKDSIVQCMPVVNSCCDDLLPATSATSTSEGNGQLSADVMVGKASSLPTMFEPAADSHLIAAAAGLLIVSLRTIPPLHMSQTLRAKLDRTAILCNNREAMLASTVNPAPQRPDAPNAVPSLMPFLAQQTPTDLAVEGLLRPRMPAIRAKGRSSRSAFNGDKHNDYESSQHDETSDDDDTAPDMHGEEGTGVGAASEDPGPQDGLDEVPTVTPPVAATEQALSRKRSPGGSNFSDHGQAKKIRLDEAEESVPKIQVQPPPTTGSVIAPQPIVLPDTTRDTTADHETVATMPAPVSEMPGTRDAIDSSRHKVKFDVESDTDESEFEIPKIHLPDSDEEDEEDE